MKLLILLLLVFPAWANHVEITSVRVHENTMVVSGPGLGSVRRVTLAGKTVLAMPTGSELVIACRRLDRVPCANERWVPGNYALKLFRAGRVKPAAQFPVTITGLERQNRPAPPEVITPRPAPASAR